MTQCIGFLQIHEFTIVKNTKDKKLLEEVQRKLSALYNEIN